MRDLAEGAVLGATGSALIRVARLTILAAYPDRSGDAALEPVTCMALILLALWVTWRQGAVAGIGSWLGVGAVELMVA